MGKYKFSTTANAERGKNCVWEKSFPVRRPLCDLLSEKFPTSSPHSRARQKGGERDIISIFFYLYECLCRAITLIYFMHLRWLLYDAESASRSIFRIQETEKRAGKEINKPQGFCSCCRRAGRRRRRQQSIGLGVGGWHKAELKDKIHSMSERQFERICRQETTEIIAQ